MIVRALPLGAARKHEEDARAAAAPQRMEASVAHSVAVEARRRADVRDIRDGLNIYLQACTGEDVLSALRNTPGLFLDPRIAAVDLLRRKLLVPVTPGRSFSPQSLYRFQVDEDGQAPLPGLLVPVDSPVTAPPQSTSRPGGHILSGPSAITRSVSSITRPAARTAGAGASGSANARLVADVSVSATPAHAFQRSVSTLGGGGKALFLQSLASGASTIDGLSPFHSCGSQDSDGSSSVESTAASAHAATLPFTAREDLKLAEAVGLYGENFMLVSHAVGRSECECQQRWEEKLEQVSVSFDKKVNKKTGLTDLFTGGHRRRKSNALKQEAQAHREENAEEQLSAYEMRLGELRREAQATRALAEQSSPGSRASLPVHFNFATALAANGGGSPGAARAARGAAQAAGRATAATAAPLGAPAPARAAGAAQPLHVALVESAAAAPAAPQQRAGNSPANLLLIAMSVTNPPRASFGLRESHYMVEISFDNKAVRTRAVVPHPTMGAVWNEVLLLEGVTLQTRLTVRLLVKHRWVEDEEKGSISLAAGELCARPRRNLCLMDAAARVVTGAEGEGDLTLVTLGVDRSALPAGWPLPRASRYQGFAKHFMIFTRGTRGDVQPFIALAIGLCNEFNWMVTFVTEATYADYIKSHIKVLRRGCIRFRVSGGDTSKRVESKVNKWAMHLESDTMQHIILAHAEWEFFDSEPACYYWAKTMRPDVICFGFTMAAVAMNVSEVLRIPLMGFLLQPTSLPSKQYPPVVPLSEEDYRQLVASQKRTSKSHHSFAQLKNLAESNPFSGSETLNELRRRRGLKPLSALRSESKTWPALQARGVPLVVPINATAFGGKPVDWAPTTVMTNYIFLRGAAVPPLAAAHETFIARARARGDKLVCLAFSSMPVEKHEILRIAKRIVRECGVETRTRVAVFALVGDHLGEPVHDLALQAEVTAMEHEGRILVDKGAPFGRLFPLLDAVVAHGGLGTTGEVIMSKIPCIITGVLLMDQRFWGMRCHDLSVGPFPVHINRFYDKCVSVIDCALAPDCPWRANAARLGKEIEDSLGDDPTGVKLNARTVHDMAQHAPSMEHDTTASVKDFLATIPAGEVDKSAVQLV